MAVERAYFKDLQNLRSERLSMYNRTRSINRDGAFVSDVKTAYGALPLVGNLRCGLWYSAAFDDHAYFKSTDGHSHMCDLNMRRLNLHLLKHLSTKGGFILVDSSRRKRFPDSMSRTVPIWAACVNAVVDRHQHRQKQNTHQSRQMSDTGTDINHSKGAESPAHSLKVLPSMVSEMEKAQLESMMPQWVAKLERTLTEKTLNDMSTQMGNKRLRPLWVSPQSALPDNYPGADELGFWPVLLVSASISAGIDGLMRMDGFTYIQGAADDEEEWAEGLTAQLFWEHIDAIMACRHDGELSALLSKITQLNGNQAKRSNTSTELTDNSRSTGRTKDPIAIGGTGMHVCDTSTLCALVEAATESTHSRITCGCLSEALQSSVSMDDSRKAAKDGSQGPLSEDAMNESCTLCSSNGESLQSYDAVVEFYVGESATNSIASTKDANTALSELKITEHDAAEELEKKPSEREKGDNHDTAHPRLARVQLVEAKADIKTLEHFLQTSAMCFARDTLQKGGKVLISCPSGAGPSVLLVLCVLCAYYRDGFTTIRSADDGDAGEGMRQHLDGGCTRNAVSKVDVSQALIYIERFHPEVARLKKMYLKIANRCLMSDHK